MGHRSSRLKIAKSALSHGSTEKVNKKYPLPVEAHMLRQIKEQYQMSGSSNDVAVVAEPILLEGDMSNNDFEKLVTPFIPCFEDRTSYDALPLEYLILDRILAPAIRPGNHDELRHDDNENEEDDSSFKLIHFPNLVVQKILDYLIPSAILALRATCTQTKAWIDQNNYILHDFEMKIDNEMCNNDNYSYPHTSPWSNIAIPYVQLHSSFVQDTIDENSEYIWKLEIYAPKCINSVSTTYPSNHPRRLFQIINKCPRLQHLSICRIDTLTELGEYEYLHIRVLSVDRIQWMNHSDFHIFENLIMKCPNLEYLKMPEFEILGSLAFVFYEAHASPEKEHLIRPLIRYMDRYRNNSVCPRHTKLYIDVMEFEDFKLCSSEVFYELSRKCKESNAVLMNVYFVPRDAVLRNQQDIVESIASMFGFVKIDFEAELWKNLEVMECWIEDFPDDLELTMRQLSFLKTISRIQTLRSLTIRLSVEETNICTATLEACVGQSYDSIQKLILRRHHVIPESHVTIPDGFGNAFFNVKYFYIQELDSNNEDFRKLWCGMPNLEELFVYKCPYLTQEAFILPKEESSINDENDLSKDDEKEQEQPILKLKKLQILVIFLYDGLCGFTDEFILKALRLMKLKGFALRGAAGVEFSETGMLSLLDSPFHDTIEDFEAPSSSFRPALSSHYWSFYVALPKKELRRNRIWLSCSVLLNSLSSRKHPYDFKRKRLGI